jgi:hypothetical protein
MSKLQEKPSALKLKENIQHFKKWNILSFFFVCGPFLPSLIRIRIQNENPDQDLDPGTPMNPDPTGTWYGSGSGSTALKETVGWEIRIMETTGDSLYSLQFFRHYPVSLLLKVKFKIWIRIRIRIQIQACSWTKVQKNCSWKEIRNFFYC